MESETILDFRLGGVEEKKREHVTNAQEYLYS